MQQVGKQLDLLQMSLNRKELEIAHQEVIKKWGGIDVLVNAAGGNMKGATDNARTKFF